MSSSRMHISKVDCFGNCQSKICLICMLPATCSICLSIERLQHSLIFLHIQVDRLASIQGASESNWQSWNRLQTVEPHFEATVPLRSA